MWTISSYDYVIAAIKSVKAIIKDHTRWKLPMKAGTPMVSAYKPELDGLSLLNTKDHAYF